MFTLPENVPQRRSPESCCTRLASLVMVADPQLTRKVGAADGATVVGAAVVGAAVVGAAVVGLWVVGAAVVGAAVVGDAVASN